MNKKIIHFHFSTSENIGDAAVVYSIRDILEKEFISSKYTSMPISYLTDIDYYKFFTEQLSITKTVYSKLHNPKLFIKFLILLMKIRKYIKGANNKQLISLINKNDLMIIGGGGLYSKWTLPFNIDLINGITIPIVIFGAGYNYNFNDKHFTSAELNSIEVLNRKANMIGVRDLNTKEFLKSLNCKSILIGDPALSMKSNKISMNFSKGIKIGLNIAYHKWSLQDEYADKTIATYIQVINELRKVYKLKVYYLKHSIWETYIVNKMKEAIPDITICDYDAYEMKNVYENLDLVISMMLHSSLFAYSSKVNFVNIAYDDKNYAFMRLINNQKNLIDVRDLEFTLLYNRCIELLSSKTSKDKIIDVSTFIKSQKNFVKEVKLRI